MSTKPSIVLVPGAWHLPTAFSPLTKYLEQNGYSVHPVALASVDSAKPQPNFDADVAAISTKLTELADAGDDLVVLTHSYGGIPGSSATKGLLKSDLEKEGKKGGVVHLIYCCSFALPEGVSLMDALQHTPLPWFKFLDPEAAKQHKENRETLTLVPATPKETFYNEIKDADAVKWLIKELRPHSYGSMWSGVSYAGWNECPATYVICKKDEAIPESAQVGMCDGADASGKVGGKEGGKINRVVLESADHTPFWSFTEELGRAVRRCAGEEI